MGCCAVCASLHALHAPWSVATAVDVDPVLLGRLDGAVLHERGKAHLGSAGGDDDDDNTRRQVARRTTRALCPSTLLSPREVHAAARTLLHAPAPPRAAQWHPACGSETCPAPPQPAAGLQTLLATCSSLAEEGSRPSSGRAAPDWWTAPQAGQPQLPRASPAAAAAAATGKPSASVNTEQPSTSLRHPPTERAGRA